MFSVPTFRKKGSSGYSIANSVRYAAERSPQLFRPISVTGNSNLWTINGWVKRSRFGATQFFYGAGAGPADYFVFATDDTFAIVIGNTLRLQTTAVFSDPSAWYHIHVQYDAANATPALRLVLSINGREVTSFSTDARAGIAPGQSFTNVVGPIWGRNPTATQDYFNGYFADLRIIDGQALPPSDFGEFIEGSWRPKKYTGTYGTNGCFLEFKGASSQAALGTDTSGNSNTFTVTGLSVTPGVTFDQMTDTPTDNFPTFNPLDLVNGALASGNLDFSIGASLNTQRAVVPLPASGKWYWEVNATNTASNATAVGICQPTAPNTQYPGQTQGAVYFSQGSKQLDGVNSAYGAAYNTGDIVGVLFDAATMSVEFFKNGVSQGIAFTGLSTAEPWLPCVGNGSTGAGMTCSINFGQRAFAYAIPSGAKKLSTANLPEPAIKNGKSIFDAINFTGTGAAQNLGLLFQPDLAWFKSRTNTFDHAIFDSMRGRASGLSSSQQNAQEISGAGNDLVAFANPGLDVGPVQNWNSVNNNGNASVYWAWKKGVAQGIDIVLFTGTGAAQSVPHALGVKPDMMIVRRYNASDNWGVYHKDMGPPTSNDPSTGYLLLNGNAAFTPGANIWNNTQPTPTHFTVGSDLSLSGGLYVAYLFCSVPGFSNFGRYIGNGSTNGPFIPLGFRPRFMMYKVANTVTGDWLAQSVAGNFENPITNRLYPNMTYPQDQSGNQLFNANGIKIRQDSSSQIINTTGARYVFAAFAETPFKYANAR